MQTIASFQFIFFIFATYLMYIYRNVVNVAVLVSATAYAMELFRSHIKKWSVKLVTALVGCGYNPG